MTFSGVLIQDLSFYIKRVRKTLSRVIDILVCRRPVLNSQLVSGGQLPKVTITDTEVIVSSTVVPVYLTENVLSGFFSLEFCHFLSKKGVL